MARHGWWIGRDVLSLGSLNLIRWATKWTSCWTQKSPQDFSTDSFHAPLSSSDLILPTFPRDPPLTWNELGYAMHENNRGCSFHRWTVSRFYCDGFLYFQQKEIFRAKVIWYLSFPKIFFFFRRILVVVIEMISTDGNGLQNLFYDL